MEPQNTPLKENKMGVMPIGKLMFTMSAPMVLSMLVQALYNVVDSMFVAKLSQDALNAVSLAFPLQTLLMAFTIGTGVGINALLSMSLGSKNYENANRAANTGAVLYVLTALVFSIGSLIFGDLFFRIQTTNETIIRYGDEYIGVCMGFAYAICFQIYMERLLSSTGRTDLAMIPQICGAVFNIIMDPILIFGLFGAPRLEVKGAAIATIMGQTLAGFIGLYLNVTKNKEIQLKFSMMRLHGETVKQIYKVGFASIIMQAIGSFMTFGLNKILIGFTEAATAVFGAYFKIQSFIFMPVFGMNNAIVPIVSYNYGAKKYDRVRETTKVSIMAAVSIMIIGAVLFETIPATLLGIFSPSEEMLKVGVKAFRIIAIHFPVAGFCIVSGSVCQALRKPMYSLTTSIMRQIVVLLPSAYLLSLSGVLDYVWFSFPIAEVVSLIFNVFFIKKAFQALK